MSSNKRSLLRILLTANGCGCGRPKPTDVFEPSPKPKTSPLHHQNPNPTSRHSLTSSTTTSGDRNGNLSVDGDDGDFTSTTASEAETEHQRRCKNVMSMVAMPKQSPKLMNSVAVEKESEDPYKDFRHSMLQMIFEKEIYSEGDLKELLECFLELNSPSQHEVILRAFMEICHHAFPSNNSNALTRVTLINNNNLARASPM